MGSALQARAQSCITQSSITQSSITHAVHFMGVPHTHCPSGAATFGRQERTIRSAPTSPGPQAYKTQIDVTSIASTVSSTTSTTFCLATREAEQKLYDSTTRGNHPSYRGKYGPSIYAPALTRTGTIMWRPRSSPAFTASRSVYADRQYDGVTMSYASKLGKSGVIALLGPRCAASFHSFSHLRRLPARRQLACPVP